MPPSRLPAPRADHVVADQSEVFAFLADPATHHLPAGESVRRIDTHGAVVFLAGARAYKVKRAVDFSFMDFSTLEKRRAACAAECAINAANAPGLYLGVRAITRTRAGLSLDGEGEPVEYAVEMRRFDPADTLDQLAVRGDLTLALAAGLAQAVSQAHAAAPMERERDVVASLAGYAADNREAFAARPDLFPPPEAEALALAMAERLSALAPLLHARTEAGFVRRCHGDLHLGNIVLLDGAPVLFDAIEFSADIATCDVLYDLAYLLMDLWQRGLRSAASCVFNRYLWARGDDAALDGLGALPFFLALRATIRAKVELAGLGHLPASAQEPARARLRHLFEMARIFLQLAPDTIETAPAMPAALAGPGARLCAIGGLSGTGKTTHALEWAPAIGRAPGALVLRSDIERKRLFGVGAGEALPQAAYAAEVTQQVYGRLNTLALQVLGTGQSVILDAVHARPQERAEAEATARQAGVPFHGIWLDVPLSVRLERVEQRRSAPPASGGDRDASDADAEVVQRQQAYETGPITWTRLTTT